MPSGNSKSISKQKVPPAKKEPKNVKQNGSNRRNGMPKEKGSCPRTSETKKNLQMDQNKKQQDLSKQTGRQMENGREGKSQGTKTNTTGLKAGRSNNKAFTKAGNKRGDKGLVNVKDEESDMEDETDNGKLQEEERSSDQESATTLVSEESSHKPPKDRQATAEQESEQGTSESDKATSETEEEPISQSSNQQENEEDVLYSGSAIKYGHDNEKPVGKSPRSSKRSPGTQKSEQGQRKNMFRKAKADKQAAKAEKQRAKAEKQRMEKEAKQKVKEEKKSRKKLKVQVQAPKGFSKRLVPTNKTNTSDKDSSVKENPDEDKEGPEPELSREVKDQSLVIPIKARDKDLKALLASEATQEEQQAEKTVQSRSQRFFCGKVRMRSLRHKANQVLAKSKLEEELSQSEVADGSTAASKSTDHLIAQQKGMSTLCKMSGWIQKKMPRGGNLGKKISVWAKAIGISHWLSVQAGKQKQSNGKPKGNLFKHRVDMKITSTTTFSCKKKNFSEHLKEKNNTFIQSLDGGDHATSSGEKDLETKCAVVLPRMIELGKEKNDHDHGSSSASATSETLGAPTSGEPKPSKPGAKLVLPVKPDLSLLKSIKKPLPGRLSAGKDVTDRSTGPRGGLPDILATNEDIDKRNALGNKNDGSTLQAARGKLSHPQIDFSKMSISGATLGTILTRQEPEKEASQPLTNGETGVPSAKGRSLYEEETDREVAELMGNEGLHTIAHSEVHWAGNPRMSGDPEVCVHFSTLEVPIIFVLVFYYYFRTF